MSTGVLFQPFQVSEWIPLVNLLVSNQRSQTHVAPSFRPPSTSQTAVSAGFWSGLADLKLHRLKLDEGPLSPLCARYAPNNRADLPSPLSLDGSSLNGCNVRPNEFKGLDDGGREAKGGFLSVQGELYCLNTAEQLLSFDRRAAAQRAADAVWGCIVSGEAERDPRLLQPLVLLTFCDLKRYRFHYWRGSPALQPPTPFTHAAEPATAKARWGEAQSTSVIAACAAHATEHPEMPCWLVSLPRIETDTEVETLPLTAWEACFSGQHTASKHGDDDNTSSGGGDGKKRSHGEVLLAILDPCNLAGSPGWPLRNVLLLAAARWRLSTLRVLCLRGQRGRLCSQASVVFDVALPIVEEGFIPIACEWNCCFRKNCRVLSFL
jgi:ubiquitin-like modifier-activating enzyme ATG7